MSVLFYWKGNNYLSDMATKGKTYRLYQNNQLMYNIKSGEHVWAFTRINGTYVLALDLIVTHTSHTPGNEYGEYCVVDDKRSRYFNVHPQIDVEREIRTIYPEAPSFTKEGKPFGLGSFFQGRNAVRPIELADEQRLISFSRSLPTI